MTCRQEWAVNKRIALPTTFGLPTAASRSTLHVHTQVNPYTSHLVGFIVKPGGDGQVEMVTPTPSSSKQNKKRNDFELRRTGTTTKTHHEGGGDAGR